MTDPAASSEQRLARLHAAIATWPLLVWGAFHVWEQSALFRGRLAWLVRMRATSSGLAVGAELVFGVLPLVLWALLYLRALVLRHAQPGAARDGDDALGRGLGAIAPVATPAAIVFLLWHVGWLWGEKVLGAASVEVYDTMQRSFGLPWALVVHAFGIAAVAWHLAAALPDGLEAAGLVTTPEGRRSTRIVGVTIGVCGFVVLAQLVGWLGTGTGTFWPITVVPPG